MFIVRSGKQTYVKDISEKSNQSIGYTTLSDLADRLKYPFVQEQKILLIVLRILSNLWCHFPGAIHFQIGTCGRVKD